MEKTLRNVIIGKLEIRQNEIERRMMRDIIRNDGLRAKTKVQEIIRKYKTDERKGYHSASLH